MHPNISSEGDTKRIIILYSSTISRNHLSIHPSIDTAHIHQLFKTNRWTYVDPTDDVEAADPVRILFAGGISEPHKLDDSAAEDAPLADEIPAKSRFLAAVAKTGFVRFFSFMKSGK